MATVLAVEKTLRGSFIRGLNGVEECRDEAFDVDTKMASRGQTFEDRRSAARKLMRAACVGGHILKASKVLFHSVLLLLLDARPSSRGHESARRLPAIDASSRGKAR